MAKNYTLLVMVYFIHISGLQVPSRPMQVLAEVCTDKGGLHFWQYCDDQNPDEIPQQAVFGTSE